MRWNGRDDGCLASRDGRRTWSVHGLWRHTHRMLEMTCHRLHGCAWNCAQASNRRVRHRTGQKADRQSQRKTLVMTTGNGDAFHHKETSQPNLLHLGSPFWAPTSTQLCYTMFTQFLNVTDASTTSWQCKGVLLFANGLAPGPPLLFFKDCHAGSTRVF